MTARTRDHGATVLVAMIATAFAVALILLTGVINEAVDPALKSGGTFQLMLLIVSGIFITIALYVGSIVTANTFATVIAGRTREIALLRLLGATSAKVRSRVATEGLVAGALGAVLGWLLALAAVGAVVTWGPGLGWIPAGRDYQLIEPLSFVAIGIVILTTWLAAWSGSRRVASVSPIAATGAAVELRPEAARGRTGRTVWAILLMVTGIALIAIGILLGLMSPLSILVSFLGGLVSFTGIAIGAHLVMPPVLRLAGLVLGRGAAASVAVANSKRYPERSARSTIGLVIGVTLVTMFAVALASYERMTLAMFANEPELAAGFSSVLAVTTVIISVLVGFSAVIAAVGMINSLSLGVLQRTRELGLLRALGFTGGQVRAMVVAESVQMTLAATGFGLVLGTFYGWLAAHSLLASQVGIMAPVLPWPVLLGIAVFGIALAAGAAVSPARRAVRVSPVEALAVS